MSLSLVPTYGAWLTSLFVETILYGIGFLQVWLYFQWWPKDDRSVKLAVVFVMFFETTQITFFFRSTFFRFVLKFGEIQEDLLWSDSLQLLANYLSAFTVQIYFASRIYRLTRARARFYTTSALGIYLVVLFALVQISAGIAQTILSCVDIPFVCSKTFNEFLNQRYKLRSFAKLEETKAITTLQTGGSLTCDIVITVYLYAFLSRNKNGLPRTEAMMNTLMMNAVNRGMLTAISSAFTMILFLVYPGTFWFFLSLAPNSKLYMNSMLATLNMRQHVRDKILNNDQGWNSMELGGLHTSRNTARVSISAVEFVKPSSPEESDDLAEKTSPVESTGRDSSADEKMD
ncbi:hypothetical protein B0H11DRAFT_2293085 [Mycena galericulata]|nr:hypothetical protein B0H11DRAFT_2293085 [Mycena galericulata]